MKISIIMCVKNSMPYLMASIKSFQMQTYKNKELIIVYSKSEDKSKNYLDSLKDKNIKVFNHNASIYSCLNYGVAKSNGDIIGILHSDDIFFNEFILKKLSLLFKNKNTNIVFGNILYSEKNNILNVKRIWDNIKIDKKFELPPHTSTFIKKDIYKKNKYNTNYKISGDTDFLLRLKTQNYDFLYLNENITIMRYGGLSTTIDYIFLKILEDVKIFKRHNLSFFNYLEKIFIKTKQIINIKSFKSSKYHLEINNISKVKYFNIRNIKKNDSKVISALNLAFLTYNYKYNLRTHNYEFWPDGIFSKILTKKNKMAGRYFIKKIFLKLNKNKIFQNIYILGNLNLTTKKWINKNLKREYIYKSLPYGNIDKILAKTKNIKIKQKSLIILTLPTPKQEIIANQIIKKIPSSFIICIGGSLNILSGFEKQVPKILNKLYLEWLWRLRFDTKRRIIRLAECILILCKIILKRKINLF